MVSKKNMKKGVSVSPRESFPLMFNPHPLAVHPAEAFDLELMRFTHNEQLKSRRKMEQRKNRKNRK